MPPPGKRKPHMINVLIIDDRAFAERPAWTQCEAAESRKPDLREKGHLCAIARRKAQLINWLSIDDGPACRPRERASPHSPQRRRSAPPIERHATHGPRPQSTSSRKGHLCAPERRKMQLINEFVIDDVPACRARAHTSSIPPPAIDAAGRALTPPAAQGRNLQHRGKGHLCDQESEKYQTNQYVIHR
jgi:hypothetical protein